ncbi:uncharacterized protein C2orf42 homolog isoform X3 [Mugil cephalus]|uniref:uncharacterized protein C2orf42 homolog isoform X3 n=1 Tax=Mugil cephalus TaxID=48193 RepID=UPI001FB63378|nr:uncharacterized protein C2orf42 homolog isoform X3 [Mugil cephalus]
MMETEVSTSSSIVPSSSPAQPNPAKRDGRKSTTPAFLSNLGRATLRGIRRCPQCGVYNGTRGLSCKNKACGVSLRNAAASASARGAKRCAVEAVKVIIDSEERGGKEPEQEGDGVLLGGGGGDSGGGGGGVQVFSVCHRGRGPTATQWGFVQLVPTDTAIATGDGATLLTRINLGRCFLPSCRQRSNPGDAEVAAAKPSPDSLCAHIKQAIECQSRATPLTLKSSTLEGLQASVQAREELWRLATESPGPLVQRVSKDTLVVKCHADSQHPLGLLHLTVAAGGASDASRGDRSVFTCACQVNAKRHKGGGAEGAASGSQPPPGSPCLHFYACVSAFASDEKLASEFAGFIGYTSSALQQTSSSRLINPGSAQAVDERAVAMSFHQWLASVTERIHHTMNYQHDGKPQPLVYHIPQDFFNALQQRLSLGSKKKRLPNFTSAFVRNDGLPLGSLSKFTWHITSLTQVKRIFDTPELPLEVTQSFVKNVDGSYSRFRCPEPPPESGLTEGHRTDRPHAIRPMDLRTFLKVGPSSADQKDVSPFVIEWIPGVLPRCQMGELRIGFEFGHQQSGHAEPHEKTSAAEKGGRNKTDCGQTKLTKGLEILQVVV